MAVTVIAPLLLIFALTVGAGDRVKTFLTIASKVSNDVFHMTKTNVGGLDANLNIYSSAFKTAGIVTIFAIGNDGPKCATAASPGDRDGYNNARK